MTGLDADIATLRDEMSRGYKLESVQVALDRVEAELSRLERHPDAWSQEAFDQQKERAEAAEARCARLQQALGNLLTYAQLDDPWGEGVQRRERYLRLLTEAREALAGPDTPADSQPEWGPDHPSYDEMGQ